MNKTINELTEKLNQTKSECSMLVSNIREDLQDQYNKVFASHKDLQNTIKALDSDFDYVLLEDGLYIWTRIDLDDFKDCLDYLETYLSDYHCLTLDAKNDCLMNYCGDDFISIQDDTRYGQDNGVWQSHDLIIPESEYLVCEDCKEHNCSEHLGKPQIDEALRNRLIEEHMEKTGVFPNVGRVTQYGDFYPVDTRPPEIKKAK